VTIFLTRSRRTQKIFNKSVTVPEETYSGGDGSPLITNRFARAGCRLPTKRGSWASPGRWERSWCWCCVGLRGSLDLNGNWGARLEKPDVADADRWWCAGIEAEVIQRSPADRVGILVLRKGFAIPSRRIRGLIEAPGCAAIPGVALGTVMRPARMLRRSVETDIRQARLETWKHNFKGLNGAIQIHVKESVLIVP
jgi:hypothetical protein